MNDALDKREYLEQQLVAINENWNATIMEIETQTKEYMTKNEIEEF